MFRPAMRAAPRAARLTLSSTRAGGSRFVSTQPPHLRSRSWKSSALRWGIAVAGIYYYNTSPVFAEQPHHNLLNPNIEAVDEPHDTSALDELVARRSRDAQKNHEATVASANGELGQEQALGGGAAELEEEASQEAAFNPETGEINWDCPCLGGMAHGPCGPQFREAFSCFVFSTEEPKGMDCIEKFQGMRDCFQEHPDIYKDELMEDEELDAELEAEKQELVNQIAERRQAESEAATPSHNLLEEPTPALHSSEVPSTQSSSPQDQAGESQPSPATTKKESTAPKATTTTTSTEARAERPNQDSKIIKKAAPPPVSAEAVPEHDSLVPKAAHDARTQSGAGEKTSEEA